VTADELADATIRYSPTITAVRPMVVAMIPSCARREPARSSEGGLAMIRRTVDGHTQWLAQWNEGWQALFLVGGHREGDESFRDCVVREVQEELDLKPDDFSVAADPAHRLTYQAFSQSASCQTTYLHELFAVTIKRTALSRVEHQPENVWLSEGEIRNLEAHDARQISVTMLSLLLMSGELRSV